MKMVFALLFLVNGEIVEDRTLYYWKKSHCIYMCQELSRPSLKYEPVECICQVQWVDETDKDIK
tara:strand:+ start:164 stop:355 length:192 start_codon:yes stop_codon:yes gene_type:complete